MIPQSYPLYATVKPGKVGDDVVWAIVGWQPPDLPGMPLNAHLIALGAGGPFGAQQTAVPDTVWADAASAAEFLAERNANATGMDTSPPADGYHDHGLQGYDHPDDVAAPDDHGAGSRITDDDFLPENIEPDEDLRREQERWRLPDEDPPAGNGPRH